MQRRSRACCWRRSSASPCSRGSTARRRGRSGSPWPSRLCSTRENKREDKNEGKDRLMTKSLREVWDHLVSHQVTRDIDGWIECFAADGIMEWAFRLKGVPARL